MRPKLARQKQAMIEWRIEALDLHRLPTQHAAAFQWLRKIQELVEKGQQAIDQQEQTLAALRARQWVIAATGPDLSPPRVGIVVGRAPRNTSSRYSNEMLNHH